MPSPTVVDLDGNSFVEYGMGLHAVTLGHAYAPVDGAVAPALRGLAAPRRLCDARPSDHPHPQGAAP